jgi:hypothetical protein
MWAHDTVKGARTSEFYGGTDSYRDDLPNGRLKILRRKVKITRSGDRGRQNGAETHKYKRKLNGPILCRSIKVE